MLVKLMDKGNMGRKTKKGIFSYAGKERSVTPEFLAVQKEVRFKNWFNEIS